MDHFTIDPNGDGGNSIPDGYFYALPEVVRSSRIEWNRLVRYEDAFFAIVVLIR
jgi:hypothetical protein